MQKYTFHTLMTTSQNLPLRNVQPMPPNDDRGDVRYDFQIKEIVIPEIQRDYAQGRGGDVEDIRKRFVGSLFKALSDVTGADKCSLNFVYGQLKRNEYAQFEVSFVPLDGQQRLTTLFLLHWYLSRLEGKADQLEYLSRFRYETRYSSSEFTTMFLRDIKDLKLSVDDVKWLEKSKINAVEGDIVPDGLLSEWLKDKPGFSTSWLDDPTIAGMLTMLDEIHRRFRESASRGFLEKLTGDADDSPIYFYFKHILPTADDGDLFIKMNSRGKLLTEFEYFKADFQRLMKEGKTPKDFLDKVANKIDQKWEPSFWRLVKKYGQMPVRNDKRPFELSTSDLDTLMMRFVNFAINTLCLTFRNKTGDGETVPLLLPDETKDNDATKYSRERLERLLFDDEDNLSEERLNTFEAFLDSWTIDQESDEEPGYSYFKETFTTIAERGSGKIPVFLPNTQCQMLLWILKGEKVDLTSEAAVLFYAATFARIRQLDPSTAAERLRMARNLFDKMDYSIRYMPYVYLCVKELMESGTINESPTSWSGGKKFPEDQVREEKFKVLMAVQDPGFHSQMRDLEESPWFKGSISTLLPADYYKETSNKQSLAAVFARRKTAFEVSFGKLPDNDVPDALIRSVLFWACRGPYCFRAKGSSWYWGASSGNFSWQERTRPFLSRPEPSKVFQNVLDEAYTLSTARPDLSGRKLLEALGKQFRDVAPAPDIRNGCDATYYMSTYYDLFFETFDLTYTKNSGLMVVDDDNSLRTVNFCQGRNRNGKYYDPYLYVIWKKIGDDAIVVDNIIERGNAWFPIQDVFVDNRADCFVISARKEQLDRLKEQYPYLTVFDKQLHQGVISMSLPIKQHSTNKKADEIDRIPMGVELFKAISALPAPTMAPQS